MPIMKAQSGSQVTASAIVMDLSDLEYEAASIMARAKADAARLVSDTKTAAERMSLEIREQARQAGHREGFDAGQQEGIKAGHDQAILQTSQQLTALADRWSKTLDLLHQNMPAHIADAKTDLVRLALSIAQRITGQEALRDRKVAEKTIEDTFHLIGHSRKVALHVNPEEEAALAEFLPDLLTKLRTIDSVELQSDPTISPGGCLATFGAGQIDAKLETQLQRIAEELLTEESEPQS
ncbi:MAG: FliH/SctL family protein [Phycisphaerales bacterium]|nr:FliH/SctL family protein [Phycisphaerales bacterium]